MDNDKFNKILEESNKAMNRAFEIAVAANVERRELTAEEKAEIDFYVAKSKVPLSAFKNCHFEG